MVVADSILATVNLLFEPEETVELRCVTDGCILNGFYRDFLTLGHDAVALNAGENIYVCLNPVLPELYARRADRTARAGRGEAVKDDQVTCRRWLLVDIDAVRSSGISATDAEKQAAQTVTGQVYDWLASQWRKECLVVADSGNGYHILIRLQDLPADANTRQICEQFLATLSTRFSTSTAKVDQTTFNAARITSLYGTIKRKGSDIPERPHRPSKLLSVPEQLYAVPLASLAAVVGASPPSNGQPVESAPAAALLDIPALLHEHGHEYSVDDAYQTQDGSVAAKYILDVCPFNSEHSNRSAVIIQWRNTGSIAFMCHHDGCKGRDWKAIEEKWGLPPSITTITAADIVFPAAPARGAVDSATAGLSIICDADVVIEPISWLWQDRIVQGGFNLFAGRGGIGKTFYLCDLTARITNESLMAPTGTAIQHGRVLYASGEDHVAKIIKPRMQQHAADSSKIEYIKGLPTERYVQPLDVIAHCALLHDALQQRPDVVALVLDPITSFQGIGDINKVADIRRFTAILNGLAEEFDIAILGIHHFCKGKRDVAGDAISGSHAYRDAARAVWLFAEDPEEPGRCLTVCDKFNWSEHRPMGLAYRIQNGRVCYEPDPVDMTSDELLSRESQTRLDTTCAWLLTKLASGSQAATKLHLAATAEGVSITTLRRETAVRSAVSTDC